MPVVNNESVDSMNESSMMNPPTETNATIVEDNQSSIESTGDSTESDSESNGDSTESIDQSANYNNEKDRTQLVESASLNEDE